MWILFLSLSVVHPGAWGRVREGQVSREMRAGWGGEMVRWKAGFQFWFEFWMEVTLIIWEADGEGVSLALPMKGRGLGLASSTSCPLSVPRHMCPPSPPNKRFEPLASVWGPWRQGHSALWGWLRSVLLLMLHFNSSLSAILPLLCL